MSTVNRVVGDMDITGNLRLGGSFTNGISRSDLGQDDLAVFPVNLVDFRTHDALQTNLPGTASSNDLALDGGTFGTSQPTLRTQDLKAAGATSDYARALIRLPAEYQAGQTVTIRVSGGMITTVSDTTAVVDIEAYRVGKDNSLGSDLCATAAQSINSLTFADKDFTITPTTLGPGDVLDVRLTITVNDGATAGAVIGCVGGVDLLCDIKG